MDKYWYIEKVSTNEVVYLPFKRDFEKQTFILYRKSELTIDSSSYWVEGVANKLRRKLLKDNPELLAEDYIVVEYGE
ncbi:MAG: hypothetical protein RR959_06025 [Erysipelotrichaceae bacterium]